MITLGYSLERQNPMVRKQYGPPREGPRHHSYTYEAGAFEFRILNSEL
jgi:hypothetical protein